MAEQLLLMDRKAGREDGTDDEFRLDEHTRELGRRGIAEVRRVLAEAVRAAAERADAA